MPVSHTQEQNNGWIGKILKNLILEKMAIWAVKLS